MSDQETPAITDGQDERAERQAEESRCYGVQMLAEKVPRAASLYFFGFGMWAVLVRIGFLLGILGRLGDDIPDRLFAAGMYCFTALSILLSLMALWLKHSSARHRAPHENPVPAAQEASAFRPEERPIQRFVGRHPRIASAYLYGYGIISAISRGYAFLRGKGGTLSLCDRILVYTNDSFTLLSVPVAVLAFCSLRKKPTPPPHG